MFFFVVSQALRENTYPFLALVVLRDNKMTVVARIEGPIGKLWSLHVHCFTKFRKRQEVAQYHAKYLHPFPGPEDLITRLNRLIENNQSSLIAARADR